jgi:hypothetical protein
MAPTLPIDTTVATEAAAVDDAMRSRTRRARSAPRAEAIVSLPKGAEVYVFFLDEVENSIR